MSTKIYAAWKVPTWRLNAFLKIYHEHCNVVVEERVYKLMGSVDKTDEELLIDFKPTSDDSEDADKWKELWKHAGRFKTVMEQCKRAALDMKRDLLFDIEVGCSVYIRGLYAYIIPWGEEKYYIEFHPRRPRWVKDYSYWNNTDPPKGFSYKQWRRRGDHWKKILNGFRLVYHAMEVPKYHGHYCDTYYALEHRIINNTKIELALIDDEVKS